MIHREHVETLEVDAAMVATGRVPNTANMGLESAGIETSRGFVAVDPHMRVMTKHGDDGVVIPNVYCIGDANNVKETKLGYYAGLQAELVASNLKARKIRTAYV